MTFYLLLAAMLWQTWPFNGTRTLPTTVKPSDAKAEVTVVSARGVRATFAAAVRADGAASGVRPTVGTVKTDDGATFDVGTAEVRWVKCTEKDPNAWFSSVPGIGERTLVPDLLVSGAADLAKDETREFLFRLEIPATANPGLYRGKLAFASSSGTLAEAPFVLRIVPPVLGPAVTRNSDRASLDGTKVFTGGEPALLSTEPTSYEVRDTVPADWTRETDETYAKEAGTVKAVLTPSARGPDRHSARRWHAIGVRDYLEADLSPALANPQLWRREAGVRGYLTCFDGVVVPKVGKDTLVGAAVEEGLVDARYLSAVSQAAHRLRYAKDYKLTLEGRMGSFFVDQNDDIEERSPDLDVLRLEAIATLVRLDAFLAKAKEAK